MDDFILIDTITPCVSLVSNKWSHFTPSELRSLGSSWVRPVGNRVFWNGSQVVRLAHTEATQG